MKTQRIKGRIIEFLKDESKNIVEILDDVNKHFKHGSNMQQLGNVLSKERDFIKIGMVKRAETLGGYYNITEWALRDNTSFS